MAGPARRPLSTWSGWPGRSSTSTRRRGRKVRSPAGWRGGCASGDTTWRSSRWRATASTSTPPSGRRRWCCRPISTACRPTFRAARRTAGSTGAAPATRRASRRRRWGRSNGCVRTARPASPCCSWSAKNAAATAPGRPTGPRADRATSSTASRPTAASARRPAASTGCGCPPAAGRPTRRTPRRACRPSRSWSTPWWRCARCGCRPAPGSAARATR